MPVPAGNDGAFTSTFTSKHPCQLCCACLNLCVTNVCPAIFFRTSSPQLSSEPSVAFRTAPAQARREGSSLQSGKIFSAFSLDAQHMHLSTLRAKPKGYGVVPTSFRAWSTSAAHAVSSGTAAYHQCSTQRVRLEGGFAACTSSRAWLMSEQCDARTRPASGRGNTTLRGAFASLLPRA